MLLKRVSKKSQGISLTTVVVAALALLVLIVLILIFSGRMGIFQSGVANCPAGTTPQDNPNCERGIPRLVIGSGDNVEYCCPDGSPSGTTTGTTGGSD